MDNEIRGVRLRISFTRDIAAIIWVVGMMAGEEEDIDFWCSEG